MSGNDDVQSFLHRHRTDGRRRPEDMTVGSNQGAVEIDERLKIIPGANTVVAGIDKLVNWGRLSSLWPMVFGLA